MGLSALRPHTLTNAAIASSENWSGEIAIPSTANLTGVSGAWTVPAVQPSAIDEASGTWIGIDGVEASSLIQTGTAQNSGPGGGYYAWVELLPAAPQEVGPVAPGDVMDAIITETSLNVWTVGIADITQNWQSLTQNVPYNTPGLTAEWIEEDPSTSGGLAPFADYGSTGFTDIEASTSTSSEVGLAPIYMTNSSGAIISYPGSFDATTNSFPITYGSPSPQVTSVSPSSGSTAGGTAVTIGGSFVTGVETVDVGGVSVPFTPDIPDGTVSAVVPAHAAGAVDITVTTPGGTSGTSGADEFSYNAPAPPVTSAVSAGHGYWLVGTDGGIFTFGSAQFYGSTGSLKLQRPVVGIVPTSDRGGYWLDASDGGDLRVRRFGLPRIHTRAGAASGRVGSTQFARCSHRWHGALRRRQWLLHGGVGRRGLRLRRRTLRRELPRDRRLLGRRGRSHAGRLGQRLLARHQERPHLHIRRRPLLRRPRAPEHPGHQRGTHTRRPGLLDPFWNGAVANYGDAGALGSPAGQFGGLNPAFAIFATADGGGYWVASADGAVDNYGDAPNDGSMAGKGLNGSIIAGTGW